MTPTAQTAPEKPALRGPVPRDVRWAVAFMRERICRPLSMADLVVHCCVSERTLNAHFRAFTGISPITYHRRLRLAAAREALLAGDISVTEVARRYGFNHAGRFSSQYRDRFGETPSATLRRAGVRSRPAGSGAGDMPDEGDARQPCPAIRSRERPSLAIVLGPAATDPGLRRVAEPVAERIAAALGAIRALTIMVPTAAHAAGRDVQRLAREIGARYVLTGSIVRQGVRLRCILRVVEAATGHHVWGDSFDGASDQPLALQDRVVAGVLRSMVAGIRGAEIDRAARAAPRDLDAYGLAMRALPLLYASTPDAAHRALEVLHRAIEIDPDYGLATGLAAWGHGQLVMYNATAVPAEERLQARRLTQLAGILDDDDPLALAARCAVHTMAGELDVAEALAARALARDPSSGWAWGRSGWLQSYRGNAETALAHFRRALLLGPGSSRANIFVGIASAHFNAGRYAPAASWVRRAMREQPELTWANRSLAVCYARSGEPLLARQSLDALRRYSPDLTVSGVVAAVPYTADFLERLGNGLSELGLPP